MRAATGVAAAGAVLAAYALIEPYRFRIASIDVPVDAGAPPLTVLHVSDTHMRARTRAVARFLASLPEALGLVPDIVAATGDLIEDDDGIEPLLAAIGGLQARLARVYVFGSHDHFGSGFRWDTYTKYFGGERRPVEAVPADTARLRDGLGARGWIPLLNTSHVVDGAGARVRLCGVDDPYIHRHRTDHIAREPGDDLAIGLMHAPDVVTEFAAAGFDLVLAGHTHGGQVRVPGWGALVTNCSLPAGLAGGLHRVGWTWLHVSPGLGTARFGPIRFNCRPEATLLRLVPAA